MAREYIFSSMGLVGVPEKVPLACISSSATHAPSFDLSIFAFELLICVVALHAGMVEQRREEGCEAVTLLCLCRSANKATSGVTWVLGQGRNTAKSSAPSRSAVQLMLPRGVFQTYLSLDIRAGCPCDRTCRPILHDAH